VSEDRDSALRSAACAEGLNRIGTAKIDQILRTRAVYATRMGIQYRKRQRISDDSWLNYSKSGVSASKKIGPVTFNSRGGVYVKLPGGLHYRGRWK